MLKTLIALLAAFMLAVPGNAAVLQPGLNDLGVFDPTVPFDHSVTLGGPGSGENHVQLLGEHTPYWNLVNIAVEIFYDAGTVFTHDAGQVGIGTTSPLTQTTCFSACTISLGDWLWDGGLTGGVAVMSVADVFIDFIAGAGSSVSARIFADHQFVGVDTGGDTANPNAVPLPAAGWFLIISLGGFMFAGRRRKRATA